MLENNEILKSLEAEGIYIHHTDFTRDYKGVFNKLDLITHLLFLGFRM
jgi:hypothetical protein